MLLDRLSGVSGETSSVEPREAEEGYTETSNPMICFVFWVELCPEGAKLV
jgi:hypothetical protein